VEAYEAKPDSGNMCSAAPHTGRATRTAEGEPIVSTLLNPYISFRDTARDALTFYQSVFGGDLALSTFGDFHASEDPAETDKIMHGMLTTEKGLVLMGADTPNSMDYSPGNNISVSLSGDDEAELRGYYDKLSGDGGTVTVPMDKAPWGDIFGMCTDKFGIAWLVNVSGASAATAP
jgi:PhnB protein